MQLNRTRDSKPARRFTFHGVRFDLCADLLTDEINQLLRTFETPDAAPSPATPITGCVREYDQAEVLRHLSPNAIRVATPNLALGEASDVCMELYQEGERFWLVDDRWGMAEINLLKGTWRSWVLPIATLDAARCAELAILWPLAQILRGRGLYLIPASSIVRGDFGVLLISPFGIDAELSAAVRGGFGVVGQRWTCLRESETGQLTLLHVPGRIDKTHGQRLLASSAQSDANWIDLTAEFCGSHRDSADCDLVLVVEPGRRSAAHAKQLPPGPALDTLRRAWPIVELHRQKRQLPMKLANFARICSVQLSRRPEDLLVLLQSLQAPQAMPPSTPQRIAAKQPDRRFVPSLIKA